MRREGIDYTLLENLKDKVGDLLSTDVQESTETLLEELSHAWDVFYASVDSFNNDGVFDIDSIIQSARDFLGPLLDKFNKDDEDLLTGKDDDG